jgi:hypothetical protein
MHRKLDLMATLGGVFYPVLAISGLLVMSPTLPPDFEAPPAEIAERLATHAPDATTAFGASLEFAGLLMLLLFAYRLAAWLGDDWASRAAAALAAAGVTVKIASFAPVIIALWYSDGLSAQTKATLFRLNDGFVPVSEAAVFAFTLLAGALILASARLPRWLGWYAVLAAAAAVADLYAQTGLLEVPALLWLIVASVALARARGRDRSAHATSDTDAQRSAITALTGTSNR